MRLSQMYVQHAVPDPTSHNKMVSISLLLEHSSHQAKDVAVPGQCVTPN